MTILKRIALGLCALLALLAATVAANRWQTQQHIASLQAQVQALALATAPVSPPHSALPEPVARYARFALPDGVPAFTTAHIRMAGDFRRPMKVDFAPTSATQTAGLTSPALVFSASTPIVPGVWATAYDAYLDGQMEMRAKVLDTLTVMNAQPTPELNHISLRRWLLEGPTYPPALLQSPFVRWETINNQQARVLANYKGATASMLVTFEANGAITSMQAETDGDLATPYHGSGEHAARSDYRLIQGMRVPHGFVISRAAQGKLYPFWRGQITAIAFD